MTTKPVRITKKMQAEMEAVYYAYLVKEPLNMFFQRTRLIVLKLKEPIFIIGCHWEKLPILELEKH